jgi:uncharacterized protein
MIRRIARAALLALVLSASARAEDANDRMLMALSQKDANGVAAALAQGADPNHLDPQINATPLVIALTNRQPASAMLLLEKGANPNAELARDGLRVPALLIAIAHNDPVLIGKLVDCGADVAATDNYGNTALTQASFPPRKAIIRVLLEKGADPNQLDGKKHSALLWAIQVASSDTVDLLLAHGADPNLAGAEGLTPLKAARKLGHKGIMAALKKAGAK